MNAHPYQPELPEKRPDHLSDRLDLLMERLRIQSIIQRLRKRHGEDHALKIIQQAVELEFGLNKQHEQTQQTRVGNTHRSQHLDSN